jgi:alpha-tubulin suppressor-like RCC1 family protein
MAQNCLVYGWGNDGGAHSLYFPAHWLSTNLPIRVYLTAEEAIIQCGYELICRSRYEDSLIRRCIDRALVFRTGINVSVLATGKHMLVFATQDAVVWTVGLNNIKPRTVNKNDTTNAILLQEPTITSVASGTHVSNIAVGDYHCLLVAAMSGTKLHYIYII